MQKREKRDNDVGKREREKHVVDKGSLPFSPDAAAAAVDIFLLPPANPLFPIIISHKRGGKERKGLVAVAGER